MNLHWFVLNKLTPNTYCINILVLHLVFAKIFLLMCQKHGGYYILNTLSPCIKDDIC